MRTLSRLTFVYSVALAHVAISAVALAQIPLDVKFDFSSGPAKPGYTRIAPTVIYDDLTGYGYEPGAQVATGDHGNTTTADRPFMFSVKVPEGNFNVRVTFGDSTIATTTTLKAESGRLMYERVEVPAGEVAERNFTTNVRTPKLPRLPTNAVGREEVSLDQFDGGNARDWDDKLTIEIVSPHAALRSIEVTSTVGAPTVFLAGDSTVTDRDGGGDVSWGQLLPRFFKPGVAVSNQAQSGETLKSFAAALRLDKILSQMKKGDYLFIQFAHNDSKKDWPQTYVAPETTYKNYLKVYIAEARLRGAIPVLITPMDRGNRTTGAPMHGHGLYPQAMREVATEEHVPLIDLYPMSIAFYDAAGLDAPSILADGTHSTAYGGYEFAKCIVLGIKDNNLNLANFIADDFKSFDPAHPDSLRALNLAGLFSDDEHRRGLNGNAGITKTPTAHPATPVDPGLGPP
jgi:lysophospholipase L1-like esterase